MKTRKHSSRMCTTHFCSSRGYGIGGRYTLPPPPPLGYPTLCIPYPQIPYPQVPYPCSNYRDTLTLRKDMGQGQGSDFEPVIPH